MPSFVCLDCGPGREAAYDIHVTMDDETRIIATHHLGGKTVPSPLRSPRCPAREGGRIRIMRPGRVAKAHLYET